MKKELVRRDIRGDVAGIALVLQMTFVNAATCEPLAGLVVDIWHAAPDGNYSAVNNGLITKWRPNNEESDPYLRGTQITDAEGRVEFLTLYPGWYEVTPPHIHFSAQVAEGRSFTSQYFMDDDFSDRIYSSIAPYAERGIHQTRIAGSTIPNELVVRPKQVGELLTLSQTVGVRLNELSRPCGYGESSLGCTVSDIWKVFN